jgi:hypothetical protein
VLISFSPRMKNNYTDTTTTVCSLASLSKPHYQCLLMLNSIAMVSSRTQTKGSHPSTNLNHPRSESKLSVRCTIGFSHILQAHGDPPTKRSVFRVCNRRCTLAAQPDLGSEYSMFRDPATQYKLPISGQTAQRQRATIEKSL